MLIRYSSASAGRWLRECFRWRIGTRGYATAVSGPLLLTLATAAGLKIASRDGPNVDAAVLGATGILVVAFIFSLGEEYG
jgi:hypothetical protein